ncbi:hypothetical protein KJA16_02775 [Patescibacteria group bacterium]|nr:hypothetical protein [Patescibacteria group bacterium]
MYNQNRGAIRRRIVLKITKEITIIQTILKIVFFLNFIIYYLLAATFYFLIL